MIDRHSLYSVRKNHLIKNRIEGFLDTKHVPVEILNTSIGRLAIREWTTESGITVAAFTKVKSAFDWRNKRRLGRGITRHHHLIEFPGQPVGADSSPVSQQIWLPQTHEGLWDMRTYQRAFVGTTTSGFEDPFEAWHDAPKDFSEEHEYEIKAVDAQLYDQASKELDIIDPRIYT